MSYDAIAYALLLTTCCADQVAERDTDDNTGSAPELCTAGVADVEVLLDLLSGSNRVEAERVFERAFARSLFSEREVVAVLEHRRSASLAAEAAAAQHTGGYQSPILYTCRLTHQ